MEPGASTTDPEELVQRWFDELFNRGELGVADEILADDVRYHGPPSLTPSDVTDPEGIKEYVDVYGTAFPDLWYSVERVSGGGGDGGDGELVVWWSATGTHESDLFELEPTGEAFTVDGVNVFTVEGGRITEVHSEWDTLKMVQELGVVPPIGLAAE